MLYVVCFTVILLTVITTNVVGCILFLVVLHNAECCLSQCRSVDCNDNKCKYHNVSIILFQQYVIMLKVVCLSVFLLNVMTTNVVGCILFLVVLHYAECCLSKCHSVDCNDNKCKYLNVSFILFYLYVIMLNVVCVSVNMFNVRMTNVFTIMLALYFFSCKPLCLMLFVLVLGL